MSGHESLMPSMSVLAPLNEADNDAQQKKRRLDGDIDDFFGVKDQDGSDTDPDYVPSKSAAVKKKKKKAVIDNPQLDSYNDEEYMYWHELDADAKQFVAETESKMKTLNEDHIPLRFKVLQSGVDDKLKAVAIQKLNHMYDIDDSSSEYHKTMQWVEAVCKIPFNKYKQMPVNSSSPVEEIREFLTRVKKQLDEKVYGHADAKDHILRLLAQWISNPASKGMVIGIHGPMGAGKTTLVNEGICAVLGLPFAFIPLGGTNDGCYLEGHSYTYEGATWGKIVDVLMKCGCMNPVLFFDELDKVSETYKGEEIVNLLIHLTDSSQNDKFNDKYFSQFEFDLSRCLIIFSYNTEERVNPILRDRMVCIKTNGYTDKDKIEISRHHMIPAILKEYNFNERSQIVFTNDVLQCIINLVDEEQGVRNLKRALYDIVSNLNMQRFFNDQPLGFPYQVTEADAKRFVHGKRNTTKNPSLNMMYI